MMAFGMQSKIKILSSASYTEVIVGNRMSSIVTIDMWNAKSRLKYLENIIYNELSQLCYVWKERDDGHKSTKYLL